ncbi:hypothetical protein ACOSP7_026915 [Xanthoceras sorbifolium]
MDELAKTLLEGSGVVDSVAADMEALEGAVSAGPIIQIDFSSISIELILTPKKPNARKWKRAARKDSGQSSCDLVVLGEVIRNSDEGLVVAKQLGLPVALTEVDASSVVDGVNLLKPSLSVVGLVISDIQALSVARSSNSLAHNLASLALSSGRDFLWQDICPSIMLSL